MAAPPPLGLKLQDDAALPPRSSRPSTSAPAEHQEQEYTRPQNQEARPRGEKRHHPALNRASCRTPLDILRGSLTLQNVLEVPKVLLELQLGVGYRPGGNLPDLAPRRVRVVHLHLHPGAPRTTRLYKTHLSGGLHLSLGAVPCYCAVVLLLGGLGLPLKRLTEGTLDPPAGGV